jgi:hypothetical protein
MLRFIVMTTGYVENASTSLLVYQCGFFGKEGYTSYKEAITDLALDMYAKFHEEVLSVYQNRYRSEVKECCRDSLIDNSKAKFCSICGCRLLDKEFHPQDFIEYIRELQNSTCDDYGESEYCGDRKMTWWPWWAGDLIGAPKEDVIYIAENAEVILLHALLEARPELYTGDLEDYISDTEWEKFKNNQQPSYR